MQKKSIRSSFILSILGHAIFIGFLVFNAYQYSKPMDRVSFINAYVQVDSGVLSRVRKKKLGTDGNTSPFIKTKISHVSENGVIKFGKGKIDHTDKVSSKYYNKERVLSQRLEHQKKINTLLVRLHNLIYAKQRYPESALMLGIEGACKVGFTLHSDGHFEHIVLLHSSGNSALDKAALSSVVAVNPISNAEKYVAAKETLSIWIYFKIK